VVWRDIMVEGPAVDDGAARAAWLAPRLGRTRKTYAGGWREDRWLGGVHLRPGARLWRWDGSRILRE